MDWKGPACLFVVILGIFLFLYGANNWNNFVGWAGVYLFVGGILAFVVLWLYSRLRKRSAGAAGAASVAPAEPVQKP